MIDPPGIIAGLSFKIDAERRNKRGGPMKLHARDVEQWGDGVHVTRALVTSTMDNMCPVQYSRQYVRSPRYTGYFGHMELLG